MEEGQYLSGYPRIRCGFQSGFHNALKDDQAHTLGVYLEMRVHKEDLSLRWVEINNSKTQKVGV